MEEDRVENWGCLQGKNYNKTHYNLSCRKGKKNKEWSTLRDGENMMGSMDPA